MRRLVALTWVCATGALLSGRWKEVKVKMRNNCYFSAPGKDFNFAGLSLDQWRDKGHDTNSIIADPLFVDPDNYDFRLKPDSPALKLGFKPFDYTKAGVYGDPTWKRKAKSLKLPPLETPPGPHKS